MPFCSNCGKEVSEDTNFCPECGQRIVREEPIVTTEFEGEAKKEFTPEESQKYIEELKASIEEQKRIEREEAEKQKKEEKQARRKETERWMQRHKGVTIALIIGILALVIAIPVSIFGGGSEGESEPIPPTTLPPAEEPESPEVFKASCITPKYDDLARYTESYVGQRVYYRGEVSQVMEGYAGGYVLRIAVTEGEYGIWDDVIWVNYSGPRVLEEDIVKVWGTVKGRQKYTAIFGNEIVIPEVDCAYLERSVAPKEELSALCMVRSWNQEYYEYLDEWGLVEVHFEVWNTGNVEIDYYEVYLDAWCHGDMYSDWTNGTQVGIGEIVVDTAYIDTANKEATSVTITDWKLEH